MDQGLQQVLLAVVSVITGGGLMKLMDWLATRRKEQRAESLQDREGMIKEYSTFLGELRGEVHQLRNQVNELTLKHETCVRENAALTVEVRQLQARLAELSTGGGEAMIVTDDQGVILAWSPEAAILFGWSGSEALGKNVAELIVPDDYRELHQAAMERWRKQDRPPRGQPLIFRGQDRRGNQFPMDVSLSGYKAGGHWNLTATIRRRADRFD